MNPSWSVPSFIRGLLVPGVPLLAVLITAAPAEAATSPAPAAPAGAQAPSRAAMDAAHLGSISNRGRMLKTVTQQIAKPGPKSAGKQPASGSGPLVYHGGQVQAVPQVYLSFWGADWHGSNYQPANNYLQGFFGNVGGSPWLGVTTQYCAGSVPSPGTSCSGGTSLKAITNPPNQLRGSWIDDVPVSYNSPASACNLGSQDPGDCDVMLAAQRAAAHFGPLPAGAVIMVMTPSQKSQPGFVSSGWCAYHWATVATGAVYGYLPYMPDAGPSCGAGSVNSGNGFDGYGIVGGHEYAEAITDPYPNSGWIDASNSENGDKCSWTGLTDIPLGGQQYAVQPTWSNATDSCDAGPPAPVSFSSLGGSLTSEPTATSWAPGRLDSFARGSNNQLMHRWSDNGSWSAWEDLGGVLNSEPAVVSWGPGRLDLFVRGTDNGLWHKWYSNGWSGWEGLGGGLGSGPTAASWAPGRLDLFVQGTDQHIYHKWYSSGWSHWEAQGGLTTSSPAAVSWGSGRLDVFVRGTDNALYHKWFGSGWSGWESFGGSWTWGPAVTSKAPNVLDVFTRGTDNSLYRKTWNGQSWSSTAALGGGQWPTGAAATSQPSTGTIDLFEMGSDSALYHAALK